MSVKCQAQNPVTCRIHGRGFTIDKIYKKFKIQERWDGDIESYKTVTNIILDLLDDSSYVNSFPEGIDGTDVMDTLYYISAGNQDPQLSKKYATVRFLPLGEIADEIFFLQDPDREKLPDVNFLSPETKKENLALFQKAKLISDYGIPLAKNASYYSWEDSRMWQHIKKHCKVAAVNDIKLAHWSEFGGTPSEDDDTYNDENHVGSEAYGQCECGRFKGILRAPGLT